ncbi:MAG: translesion error-prone DNA polymerase V autoproteolytic subunit [Methylococcaceae bacterium]
MSIKNTHGGRREGAGRKVSSGQYKEATQPVRVPASYVPMLRNMLQDLAKARQSSFSDKATVLIPQDNPPKLARPLFSSAVPAGFPSPADDYIEGQLDLNDYFVKHPAATFYVRVTGDSMINAGILPDDILIVDRSIEPTHDKIVIAVVDHELTVKRLYRRNGVLQLKPANPDFPTIVLKHDMELVIWGVVTGVTRKL